MSRAARLLELLVRVQTKPRITSIGLTFHLRALRAWAERERGALEHEAGEGDEVQLSVILAPAMRPGHRGEVCGATRAVAHPP